MIINTDDLSKKDEQYVWHGVKPFNPESTIIAKEAQGAWITDVKGNRFLDAMAGLWCVNTGYGRVELAEVAFDQMKKMAYFPLSQSHIPAIKLAEKLNEWLEDEYVVFYSNSGSEANETAFKIARQYHQQNGESGRHKFISRYRGYHGNSMGALSATGQAQRKYRYEPLTQGFIHVTPPDIYRSPYQGTLEEQSLAAADEIDRVMTWELSETVAGVIMEPFITGGGVIIPHESYLPRVREICDKHQALLIIDEVICGFGRTGAKFAFQHSGIKPDIVTMAKGITSGYLPLAVTAVRKEIYDSFKSSGEYDHFRHVSTFGGNPAACAVALKNMEIYEEEKLIERSKAVGAVLKEKLQDLDSHPYVGHIRGIGLLIGIELVKDKMTKQPADADVVNNIISYCKGKGLIIGKNGDTVAGFNNIIALSPPLNITDDDVDFIVTVLKEAFATI
ncbi:aspartate aminotransferase family protein [Pseudogracilibacillus auburnensis]|uniref:Adenosylmethionine-8-amino-7-oxononanoate aminotransferase n=1 Tax=Pseudogracilibacillus auburnensis TaxID=1494959 RepID=A0A2V3W083_9BACI|nr:aspartate aminotransferase family protein [Pseudogracilibacillus auburnensis]MBO1002148.1 aspartate aminotransferase family protein [Pseudogracilibacillus auburnensis]PXW87472.1 adenosylmethionine-8-amino-7-oxononanoate aminotransferase [Pseudogracilibacillus auburnensis]